MNTLQAHTEGRGNPFKVFGRKKGFLKPQEMTWLEGRLPQLLLNQPFTDRTKLMQHLGGSAGAQLRVEIGFGNGDFLAFMAERHPEDRFIGIDVFLEGFAAAIKKLEARGCQNVHFLQDHAQPALANHLPDGSIDEAHILFPDPWRKKRHHKRRLIQPAFLDVLASKIRPGGLLRLATDWDHYAHWMLDHLEAHPAFENAIEPGRFAPRPEEWTVTRFQKRGWEAGRPSSYLAYRLLSK